MMTRVNLIHCNSIFSTSPVFSWMTCEAVACISYIHQIDLICPICHSSWVRSGTNASVHVLGIQDLPHTSVTLSSPPQGAAFQTLSFHHEVVFRVVSLNVHEENPYVYHVLWEGPLSLMFFEVDQASYAPRGGFIFLCSARWTSNLYDPWGPWFHLFPRGRWLPSSRNSYHLYLRGDYSTIYIFTREVLIPSLKCSCLGGPDSLFEVPSPLEVMIRSSRCHHPQELIPSLRHPCLWGLNYLLKVFLLLEVLILSSNRFLAWFILSSRCLIQQAYLYSIACTRKTHCACYRLACLYNTT